MWLPKLSKTKNNSDLFYIPYVPAFIVEYLPLGKCAKLCNKLLKLLNINYKITKTQVVFLDDTYESTDSKKP